MTSLGLTLVGLAIAVGLVGIVVPVLPGTLLVAAALLGWALAEHHPSAWAVFGVAAAVLAIGQVAKYVLPGRHLKDAGVPNRSLLIGGAVGVVGFFVVPVVGLPLGFVVGVYGSEWQRLGSPAAAGTSTRAALRAAGLSVAIELAAGIVAAGVWAAGLLVT